MLENFHNKNFRFNLISDVLELSENFLREILCLRKTVKVENIRRFGEITIRGEVRISYCVCDKLTINLSEGEIEPDRIVQRAVVNKTALTMS